MSRKLASIQRIKDIQPIPKADRIEVATVNGWEVVVEKGLHEVGDKVIYCEIDSFLPIREEFEFLRKSSYKKMGDREGFRLKTIRLRGQVSQGLVLPFSILDDATYIEPDGEVRPDVDLRSLEIGADVTRTLNIVKYEKPVPVQMQGEMKGGFPWFLQKTDEERVQNLDDFENRYSHLEYDITEKLDGTSFTAYYFEEEFGVCSRNRDLKENDDNLYWQIAKKYSLDKNLESMSISGQNLAIQGEIVGPGIQGNPYGLEERELYVFNVWDINNRCYYTQEYARNFIADALALKYVPFLFMPGPGDTVQECLEFAEGKSALNKDVEREGVVFVSKNLAGKRVSFKAISNKYLLNEND